MQEQAELEVAMATVVNRRTAEFDVYIGRGSRWGNPYSHKSGTLAQFVVGSRDEAIAAYRQWLWAEIQAQRITLEDLAQLDGKRLGCYCKPLSCHGDVLVQAVEWAVQQLNERR